MPAFAVRMILTVLLCGVAMPALARGVERFLERAERAFAAEDFAKALEMLDAAYAREPRPAILANRGLVLERLGRYADAADAFDRYLASGPEKEMALAAQGALDRLRPLVSIRSTPAGASVAVDQRPIGQTPLETRIVAGTHRLRLTLGGHETLERPLVVPLDERLAMEFALKPVAPAPDDDDRTWLYVGLGAATAVVAAVVVGVAVSGPASGGNGEDRVRFTFQN